MVELRDKLLKKGFSPLEISQMCEELVRQGYLDDRRVALNMLNAALGSPRDGAKLFRTNLARRGLPRELIEETTASYLEHTEQHALAAAAALRLRGQGKGEAFIQRYLWRKGFAVAEIREAVVATGDTRIDNRYPEG